MIQSGCCTAFDQYGGGPLRVDWIVFVLGSTDLESGTDPIKTFVFE